MVAAAVGGEGVRGPSRPRRSLERSERGGGPHRPDVLREGLRPERGEVGEGFTRMLLLRLDRNANAAASQRPGWTSLLPEKGERMTRREASCCHAESAAISIRPWGRQPRGMGRARESSRVEVIREGPRAGMLPLACPAPWRSGGQGNIIMAPMPSHTLRRADRV